MAKKSADTTQHKNPVLTKSRNEVSEWLKTRIEMGRGIVSKEIRFEIDLDNLYKEEEKWHKFNVEYLNHCFDTDKIALEYDFTGATSLYINPSWAQKIESFKESMQRQINSLESIDERLALYQEKSMQIETGTAQVVTNDLNKVFIVHGHDEALKHKVARFVNKLGLHAIILDEQANLGRTVIEKFEDHAGDASYAVILLTPDDIGYPKDFPEKARPRARQNAIGELGYFRKALGKRNMAILCSDDIEIPSDFNGVLYLPVQNDTWELRLAKEMKAAGLNVDLNKL